MFKNKEPRNSQQEIVDYLKTTKFMSESEIQEDIVESDKEDALEEQPGKNQRVR